jgi:hypothetical protein
MEVSIDGERTRFHFFYIRNEKRSIEISMHKRTKKNIVKCPVLIKVGICFYLNIISAGYLIVFDTGDAPNYLIWPLGFVVNYPQGVLRKATYHWSKIDCGVFPKSIIFTFQKTICTYICSKTEKGPIHLAQRKMNGKHSNLNS